MTRFADVVALCTSRTADPLAAGIERFVGLEHIEPENLHIRSWGNVADGTTFTNTFKRGQVLFGKRRAYQRKVAVADFDGVCSNDIYVFESKDPNVLLPNSFSNSIPSMVFRNLTLSDHHPHSLCSTLVECFGAGRACVCREGWAMPARCIAFQRF